jgi:2-desacetyl-2-hydroxyethyl bacteriochlorophyllide A dehydrogenase
MRAAEVSRPGVVAVVHRPDLEPGPEELLVAPTGVGICGSDVEIVDGDLAYFRTGLSTYPIVPGHEWTGRVLAVGDAAPGFEPGDLVVGETVIGCGDCRLCDDGLDHLCPDRREAGIMGMDGALATQMLFPARAAYPVPQELGEAAALIEPASVAVYATRRAPCRDRSVLVVGAGTIGLLALQAARSAGASQVTIADAHQADRLILARELGADRTFHVDTDGGNPLDAIADPGFDVVLECSGSPAAVNLALAAVRPGGRVALVGLVGQASVPVDVEAIVLNDFDVVGVAGSPGVWPDTIRLVASGAIDVRPLITHRVPLGQVAEAVDLVRRRADGAIKVLVEPQQ